jgi:hypothetical protein
VFIPAITFEIGFDKREEGPSFKIVSVIFFCVGSYIMPSNGPPGFMKGGGKVTGEVISGTIGRMEGISFFP